VSLIACTEEVAIAAVMMVCQLAPYPR
jgi:hypothetical protein